MRLFGSWRVLAIPLCLIALSGSRADERAAAHLYDALRAGDGLEAFLRAFPKGGDLHNHMSAGIAPEKWIEIAVRRNFCVDEKQLILMQNLESRCPAGTASAATLQGGGGVQDRLVEAMSMRVNRTGASKGHDYFFQKIFQRLRLRDLGPVLGDMLEALTMHASEQNMTYLELQMAPFGAAAARIAEGLPAGRDFSEWHESLGKSAALRELAETVRRTIERGESELRERRPAEAAAIRRRYLMTSIRTAAPQFFFTQLAAAAELARIEPHVVGLNIAAAEDDPVALRDFRLHMRMIDFIRLRTPGLRVTLHAGEMTPRILGAAPGVVPEALTFHIGESVRQGNAERIGHGTALRYEKDRAGLARTMRERSVLVEICLTSAELIQDLKPEEIPFAAYRRAGVAVALGTDDEGFLGSDLSHEFLRAARDYKLPYGELKELARNSLEYSFLPGHSLFQTREFRARVAACAARLDGADCRAYLDNNPKAAAQARLEQQLREFETNASLRRFPARGATGR